MVLEIKVAAADFEYSLHVAILLLWEKGKIQNTCFGGTKSLG
jgi:hypothetical protein